MISKLRREDERRADIVSQYLDTFVYTTDKGFSLFQRIYDKNTQVSGIDVKFEFNGTHYDCDEKAAIRYVNKHLQTFSFELSFIDRSGVVRDGWLINDKCVNNSYMLIWIDSAKPEDLPNIDSIKNIQCSLVRKEAIIKYLEDNGFSEDKLEFKCHNIRENKNENLGNIKKYGLKFSFSQQLVEQPINILIPRSELMKMSDYTFELN